jgi:hypothetical protein
MIEQVEQYPSGLLKQLSLCQYSKPLPHQATISLRNIITQQPIDQYFKDLSTSSIELIADFDVNSVGTPKQQIRHEEET